MCEDFIRLIQTRKAKKVEPVFTISSDFLVGLSIGKGAFAEVFRSVHKSTGYTVALKTYEKSKLTHKS
jgi:serine/threonine protein kinase